MIRHFYYLFIPFIFFSCSKTEPEIGSSFVQADGLVGNWELSGANIIDLLTIETRTSDIAQFYVVPGEAPSSIAFTEEDGVRTFTLQLNNGINYITGPGPNSPTTGTWDVNSEFQATEVILFDGTGGVINSLRLTQSVRPYSQEMLFATRQYCGGEAVHAYEFVFSRISN